MATTLFATVAAKAEFAAEVETALRKMVAPTRAETGCVSYALYSAAQQPGVFHLLEKYADDAALASHQQTAHFAALLESLTDKLASEIQIQPITALEA